MKKLEDKQIELLSNLNRHMNTQAQRPKKLIRKELMSTFKRGQAAMRYDQK